MKSIKSSMKPRSTDPFTKGGQIFGHIWRMRWQNFKLVAVISLIGFVLGFLICALVLGLTFQEFWDFYLLSYVGGHLKVIFWPFVRSFLGLMDGWLKALMPGSRGMPEALYNISQLTTTLSFSKATYTLPTLIFLKHPFILAKVARFYACIWSGLGGFFSANLLCYWFFRRKSQNIESEKILKGQKLILGRDLQKILTSSEQASNLYLTPDLSFVKGTEVEHLLVCGATRTGKTSTLLTLLSQVRLKGQKVVVLDLTGELTAKFFREGFDTLLNPLDVRSHSWRVFNESLSPAEIEGWAASMVPKSGQDLIWSESARKLLSETTTLLQRRLKHPDMKNILQWSCWRSLTDPELQEFYKNTSLASLMNPSAERTTVGIRMNLSAQIDAFKYLNSSGEEKFSVMDWIADETSSSWLFLTALPSQREALAPLLASWCNFAFLGLERLGPSCTRRLWFIVDEFPGLNHPISALPRMVAEGAKYGACCVLSFQNKAQLDHLYTANVTKTILSNCNTKMIFRSPETSTAHDLSRLFGQQEIFESAESLSIGAHHLRDGVGFSTQQRLRPVVSEGDIMSLEKFEAFVQLPGNFPIAKVRVTPPKIPERTQAFISIVERKEAKNGE